MPKRKKSSNNGGGGGSETEGGQLAAAIRTALEQAPDQTLTLRALRKDLGGGVQADKDAWKAKVKKLAKASGAGFGVQGQAVSLTGSNNGNSAAAAAADSAGTTKRKGKKRPVAAPEPAEATGGSKATKKRRKHTGGDNGPAAEEDAMEVDASAGAGDGRGGGVDEAAMLDAGRAADAASDRWREEHGVLLSEPVRPALQFADPRLPADIVQACCGNFAAPTPIQAQCWPILLAQRDLVGLAETGSGKTLAFTLPGLKLIQEHRASGPGRGKKEVPLCLVVAPTRELALQSAAVVEEACGALGVHSACLYGGTPKQEQRQLVRRGLSFIIATPGRLRDLVEEESVDLSSVRYLVLDEADRMLDMGFLPDMRAIVQACARKEERQTAMLSATWPMAIQKLAMEFLARSIKVTVGKAHNEATANVRIKQVVEVVEERERDGKLRSLLQKYHSSRTNRVLVFALYKKEAARLERFLQNNGWSCAAVHGDKNQRDRERAVNEFKSGSAPLLIATDVAARGLDIPDVEVVINYSFPLTIEDYVHRIGRTARAGKNGTAHTFFHSGDKAHAGELTNVLRGANQHVPEALTKFGTHTKKKVDKMYGAFFKDVDMTKKSTKIVFGDD